MSSLFAVIAGLIHVYIFYLESLAWGKEKTNRVFSIDPKTAEMNRKFAFNQGFYNLFLAIGALAGAYRHYQLATSQWTAIMIFSVASMLGAALVLIFSDTKLLRAATIQGLCPLLSLIFLSLGL